MTLNILDFNIGAVVVGVVVQMVLGGLWYSPLMFGDLWLKLINLKPEDISKEDAQKSMSLTIIPALINVLLVAALISATGAKTWIDALFIGSMASIGFMGMAFMNLVLFENRGIKLSILNVAYSFVALNIAALILVMWK